MFRMMNLAGIDPVIIEDMQYVPRQGDCVCLSYLEDFEFRWLSNAEWNKRWGVQHERS